jgi:hypothetical protein
MGHETKIVFPCEIAKVQTLVDNGIRVTFDLPEGQETAAALLIACKADGHYLQVVATPNNKQDW